MPLSFSTSRPVQSMPMPYCQRVPGSNINRGEGGGGPLDCEVMRNMSASQMS